jgi:hypothetical protein
MRVKLELSEQEAKEALADWATKKYSQSVDPKDVSFSLSPGDSDPRGPSGPHISQVTISIAGLPTLDR